MSTSVTRDFVSSGFQCESANKITAGQDALLSAFVSVHRKLKTQSFPLLVAVVYWNMVCGLQFSADSSHPSMAEVRQDFDTIITASLVIYDFGNDHQLPHIIKHFYRRLLLLKHTVKITF